MNRFLHTCAMLLAIAACVAADAAVPTDFAVSTDRLSFRPTTALHKGDRLQVLSPYLSPDDVVVLARCMDDCRSSEIVRSWDSGHGRAHGPDLLEFVTIAQDGDYFFAPNQIPQSLRTRNAIGCKRSLPQHVLCGDARSLTITETKATPELFRARLSSGSWIWVRRVRVGDPEPRRGGDAGNALALVGVP
ncbi:MAG: hypothetical protein ABW187_03060 [Dokdonella sp.]